MSWLGCRPADRRGERRLPHTTGSTEKEGMVHPILQNGVTQSVDHVILPNHVGKTSRSPLAGKCLIAHEEETGVMAR